MEGGTLLALWVSHAKVCRILAEDDIGNFQVFHKIVAIDSKGQRIILEESRSEGETISGADRRYPENGIRVSFWQDVPNIFEFHGIEVGLADDSTIRSKWHLMRRINHKREGQRAQGMWVAIQKCKDQLPVLDVLRLNGKINMRIDLSLITQLYSQSIQKDHSNSLLRQILFTYDIRNLITFLPLDDVIMRIGRNSKENIVSEADPVIVANLGPFIGLVDKINDDAGLESLQDQEIEIDDGCGQDIHILECECVLNVAVSIVLAREGDVVGLVAERQGAAFVGGEDEGCGGWIGKRVQDQKSGMMLLGWQQCERRVRKMVKMIDLSEAVIVLIQKSNIKQLKIAYRNYPKIVSKIRIKET